MIDVIKTTLYVALNKPDHTCEVRRKLTECGMAAFTRPETVGMAVKGWFVDGFQNHSDNFLQELVTERRDTQRTELCLLYTSM